MAAQVSTILSSLLHWKTRFHPSLLAFGIMRHVGAADCHATPLTLARAILAA
jgi:hypothetical protein